MIENVINQLITEFNTKYYIGGESNILASTNEDNELILKIDNVEFHGHLTDSARTYVVDIIIINNKYTVTKEDSNYHTHLLVSLV